MDEAKRRHLRWAQRRDATGATNFSQHELYRIPRRLVESVAGAIEAQLAAPEPRRAGLNPDQLDVVAPA